MLFACLLCFTFDSVANRQTVLKISKQKNHTLPVTNKAPFLAPLLPQATLANLIALLSFFGKQIEFCSSK